MVYASGAPEFTPGFSGVLTLTLTLLCNSIFSFTCIVL